MTGRNDRAPLTLAAAVSLAVIAGAVDAICFDRLFGVFPANQSGNAIFLGIAVGHGSWEQVWRPALAIAGFALGVAGGLWLGERVPARRSVPFLLMAEALLLAAVALGAGDLTGAVAPLPGLGGAVLLGAASVAMGLQTLAIRDVAGVAISTTYETGVIFHLAERVVQLFRRTAATTSRRSPDPLAVMSLVLIGYIGGAALGAATIDRWGGALMLPILGVAVVLLTSPRWSAS